ncbi:MAG: hypothetical protein HKN18_13325 [Silicimonas sp.]|nr:hypothetical protein [Silicimonas sp.]
MNPLVGAKNMLQHCGAAQPGERVLIAYEPTRYGYYDADAVPCVSRAATELGLDVTTLDVGFSPDNPRLTPDLRAHFEQADIIVFLARLGDQLRFTDMPEGQRIIVSFALDSQLFGSSFGTTHHAAMMTLKHKISKAYRCANNVRVTCAKGSEFSGKPDMPPEDEGDTTILRFPMSVHQPVPAHPFSGKVALCGFLTGTGSRYYDDYTLEFDGPVFALLEKGRLAGFEGGAADVAAANAHYDRVSQLFGIDRNFVHSWHAGMHPGCGYLREAHDNFERWGGSSFGNPRILHFHTCGAYAPGEISWNMLDPTIEIDGVKVWEDGVFHAERLDGGQVVLDTYPCADRAFSHPDRHIGLAV